MKVFLDTNVMLDFLGERKLFFKPAEIIVNLADIGELIFRERIRIGNCKRKNIKI